MKEKEAVSTVEDKQVYEPPNGVKLRASIKNMDEYKKLYEKSTNDVDGF